MNLNSTSTVGEESTSDKITLNGNNSGKLYDIKACERGSLENLNIWQYWDQANDYSEIADACRICMNTISKAHPRWNHYIVTSGNLWNFLERGVDLPYDFNNYKWSKLAIKSDMVRVALLLKYGGLYIDASVIAVKSFYNMFDKFIKKYSNSKNNNINNLEFIGFVNKAPLPEKFEYSIWMMLALGPNGKLLTEWHKMQINVYKKCIILNENKVQHKHPMFLDFGDCCLKKLMPKYLNPNNKKYKNKVLLIPAFGCWNTEKELGQKNSLIYKKIVNDILCPKQFEKQVLSHENTINKNELITGDNNIGTSNPLKHMHFYCDPKEDLPYFIKIHRASAHPGDYQAWVNKQGPWLNQLKNNE